MVQGFDPNVPATGSKADSAQIRTNFNAVYTTNLDSTVPSNPLPGTLWIDTSDPTNIKLKWYKSVADGFITLLENIQIAAQAPGGEATHTFSFSGLQTLVVNHGLNKFPSVTVIKEPEKYVVMPVSIVYNNANQITITLDAVFDCTVLLN